MKESRSHKGTGDADIFMGVQLCKRGLDSYRLSQRQQEKEKPRKGEKMKENGTNDFTTQLT